MFAFFASEKMNFLAREKAVTTRLAKFAASEKRTQKENEEEEDEENRKGESNGELIISYDTKILNLSICHAKWRSYGN